jgi:hypothetical protein
VKSILTLTKKDIVVVLVCAFFLLMNLGAIGARGREHAKRTLCASQLGKWARAIIMHAEDNDGRLMFMVRRWGEGPFPHYMGQVTDYNDASPEAEPGEWNVFEINPYIGAFSETYYPPEDCGVTKFVACPSASEDFMVDWCTWNCEWDWDFTEPGYSYWVIGGMPNPPNSKIKGEAGGHIWQDLTIDTLSSDRLLMSDILTIDNWGVVGSPYRYNHGKTGWSWFTADLIGHEINDPYPKATGRSQAFGDGSVKWRAIPPQYEDNLPNTNDVGFTEDRWNGPGSGWIQYWNTSWY